MGGQKKPKGWYGKDAKAERRQAREAKRAEAQLLAAERERETARRAEAVSRAKSEADVLAARVEARAIATSEDRRKAEKSYRRQARDLRRELTPKSATDDGPTPHTRRQHRKTSFERLCEAKLVTGEMLQAAQEVERVYLAICGATLVRGQSLDSGGGQPRPMANGVALAHALRYRPWADALSGVRKRGGWPLLELVIDVVVDGRSLDIVEKERGWKHGTAKFGVLWALMKYAVMARWADPSELTSIERRHGLHRRLAEAA